MSNTRMVRRILCLCAAQAIAAAPAEHGAYFAAEKLLEWCSTANDGAGGLCFGIVGATMDAAIIETTRTGNFHGWAVCIPDGYTIRQTAGIVGAFLRAHPEQQKYTAVSIIAQVLETTFPCPAQRS